MKGSIRIESCLPVRTLVTVSVSSRPAGATGLVSRVSVEKRKISQQARNLASFRTFMEPMLACPGEHAG